MFISPAQRDRLLGTLTMVLIMVFSACRQSPEKSTEQLVANKADIDVSWQLISNFVDKGGFDAKFILNNRSELTLADTGWAMYFNIAPRMPIPYPTPQPAHIEHVNGDWFRLVPDKGFRLEPGKTIEVYYRGGDFVIKETDAPLGIYFVINPGPNEQILNVGNANVLPFTTREQLLRGKNEGEQILTPELRFSRNAAMTPVDPSKQLPVIPEPAFHAWGAGSFSLASANMISYADGLENEASFLAEKLKQITGKSIGTSKTGNGQIRLSLGTQAVNNVSTEAYAVNVRPQGIEIRGSDPAGVFYGVQTLLALIPLEAWQKKTADVMLRSIEINDAPRFAFRSLHLDLGRNFQKKQTVLKLIDILAAYKINHMLFYMTEDEGWRVEIPGLPELTQVGAFRKHVKSYKDAALHPAYGSGPTTDTGSHGNGYYTRADFIDILKYAKTRHIQVIPEVNFPGHARAAIKAMEARYERLMKEGKAADAEQYRLVDPNDSSKYYSAQGYKDNVVDVTRESVYVFYEKVMDELAGMYKDAGLKLTKIHMGGDEVPNGAWEGSPAAQKLFNQNPALGTYKNLHGHFVRTIMPRLQKRGLEVHAWEEAALSYTKEGGNDVNKEFANSLVPYIWNSIYDPTLAYRMANAGYKIVLCNVSNFYFDLAYNNSPKEPGLYWGGFVDTWDAFAFNPYDTYSTTYVDGMGKPMVFPNKVPLSPEARKNIIGVEAQLWSETVKGEKMLEYYTLPKLFAFANSAWAWNTSWQGPEDPAQRNKLMAAAWNVFANSLAAKDLPRLSYMNGGYNYRVPPPGAILNRGQLKANAEFPGLQIRYTTDGKDPDINSELFTAPVKVRGKIRLRCFDAAGKGSDVIEL